MESLIQAAECASNILKNTSNDFIEVLLKLIEKHAFDIDTKGKLIGQQTQKLLTLYLEECPDVSAFAASDETTPIIVAYRLRCMSDGLSRLLLSNNEDKDAETLNTLTNKIAEAYEMYADASMQISAIINEGKQTT